MIKKNIPNAITCLNLFCGCLAIAAIAGGEIIWGSILIVSAAVLDFFDGFAARLLRVSSEIGKQLDSLADAVSFCVAPGFILFQMITISFGHYYTPIFDRPVEVLIFSSLGFLISIFGIIRLANFNLDTRQSENFIGVPTPATALFVAALIPILTHGIKYNFNLNMYMPPTPEAYQALETTFRVSEFRIWILQLLFNPYFYLGVSVVFSFLMVSSIPIFSMKFKGLKNPDNIPRLTLILISLLLVWRLEFIGLPLIILAYVVIAFAYDITKKLFFRNNNLNNEIQS
ncbi:MAG: CDP-alcohol phosphatidyltransferase family protein [Bacteroidetes bacterium]|nr:CDP-alcohol phosphatidyltransferase family protein [Bacteroidota bacterium]